MARKPNGNLERLKKYGSHSVEEMNRAVFLIFGFHLRQGYGGQVVSAQLPGFSNLSLRRSLAKKIKNPRAELATVFF
jgi:hypothetical protein